MLKLANMKHTWEGEVREDAIDEFRSRIRPKTAANFIDREHICEPDPLSSDTGFKFTRRPPKTPTIFEKNEKDKLAALQYEHHVDAIPECVKMPDLPVYYDRSLVGSTRGGEALR